MSENVCNVSTIRPVIAKSGGNVATSILNINIRRQQCKGSEGQNSDCYHLGVRKIVAVSLLFLTKLRQF